MPSVRQAATGHITANTFGAGVPRLATKTLTFTGAANFGQSTTNAAIFTVTGEVRIVSISGWCVTDLAGVASTVSLGVTSSVALFIAATTATTVDTGLFWVSATPTANGIALPAACKDIIITDNIVIASATQDTTGGVLRIDVFWLPLSSDAALVAA